MMNRLKIAMLHPYRKSVGGGEKFAVNIAKYLSKKHDVEYITQKFPRNYLDLGSIKVKLIKPKSLLLSPFAFLFNKIRDYDLIIQQGFPATLSSIFNKPTLTISGGPKKTLYDLKKEYLNGTLKERLRSFFDHLFIKRIDKLSQKKTNKILSYSETVRERNKRYYKRDSEVLYPGIDYDKYKTGKYGDYILLCASRFIKAKRADIAIKSMGYVKNKAVKLYVVGEGGNAKRAKEISKKYPNVKFIGFVSEEELINLYANCLAVVYVPLHEDFGLIPVEAGASGKLCIGANDGGLKETIIHNKTGFLLDNVNPKSIAEKIDYLMKNKKIAKKMGIEARKYVKKFDNKTTMKSLDKAIEELISNKKNKKKQK